MSLVSSPTSNGRTIHLTVGSETRAFYLKAAELSCVILEQWLYPLFTFSAQLQVNKFSLLTTPQLSQHNASQNFFVSTTLQYALEVKVLYNVHCTTSLQKTYRTFTAKLAHRPIYPKFQGLRHCNINFFAKTAALKKAI